MRLTVALGLLLGFLMVGPALAGQEPIELTFEKAIEHALQHNLELKIAKTKLEKALLELQQVESAFDPELTATLSPLRWTGEENLNNYQPNATIIGSLTTRGGTTLAFEAGKDAPDSRGNDTGYGLTLSQQLLPWPTSDPTLLSLENSRLSLDSEYLSVRDQVETLKLDVLSAYYAVLQNETQTEVAKLDLEYAKEYLLVVEHKREQGVAGKLDVLDAQAEYTSAQHSLLQSEDNLNRAMYSLKDLIGISPWQDIDVQKCDLDYQFPAISIEQAQKEALGNEVTILQQQIAVEQQKIAVAGQRSKFSPSLDLSLGYTYSGPESITNNYEAALTLSIPLFDGKDREASIGMATNALKQAELTMQRLQRDLARKVSGYVLDLQETRNELEYLEKVQEQRCVAFSIAQEMFEAGTGTMLEVLEREITYAKGKMEYLNTMKQYEFQKAQLRRITGRELGI